MFPKAMINKDGLTVMFYSHREGCVIGSDGFTPLGHYIRGLDKQEGEWKNFTGTITINLEDGRND